MKKLIFLIVLILISSQSSFALNSSLGEMQYKKKKALAWYASRANHKLYKDTANKEISNQKNKAFRWYQSRITASANQINSSKKKALSWYERNSK